MPRYSYKCATCLHESLIFHLIGEAVDICTNCTNTDTMERQLTTPTYLSKVEKQDKVGDVTKEYIEANKELLESERQKAKSKNYEPT
jgi:hypothetical protein